MNGEGWKKPLSCSELIETDDDDDEDDLLALIKWTETRCVRIVSRTTKHDTVESCLMRIDSLGTSTLKNDHLWTRHS